MEGQFSRAEFATEDVVADSELKEFNALEMLRLVSRTFAIGIENLPSLLREAITAAYLLFRVSDFLEDNEEMSATRKAELLRLWARVLDGQIEPDELTRLLQDTDPDDPEAICARHAGDVLALLHQLPDEVNEYIIDEVRATSYGMARWQDRGPVVVTEEDLDDYMFEVAGRVGYLITHIFAWHARPILELKDELMPLAKEFGLALQTVNVIRGLRKDFERGWVFVPESFCHEVGIKPPDLFKPENLERSMLVVEALADKAEGHLRHGLEYIKLIPRRYHRLRLFCIWPLFFAVRTLAISRRNREVLIDEAKITRKEVKQIIVQTQMMGWSNHWLDYYYDKLAAR